MLRPGRNILALLLSFAIGVVSATCTSAGCLIASPEVATRAQAPVRPCCAERHRAEHQTPAQPVRDSGGKNGKDCPLCHYSVVVAKGAEKSTLGLDTARAPLMLLAVLDQPAAAADFSQRAFASFDRDSAIPAPSTSLFALHCALLS